MKYVNNPLLAFNRGLVSRTALSRLDLQRMALSAEIQTNWMPRTLGSMMLRPGLIYTGEGTRSDNKSFHIPFIFSNDDTAIIEMTAGKMRVKVDEETIARASVTSSVNNGTFTSNISGWTDNSDSGASTQWVSGGYAGMTGTGFNKAELRQTVSIPVGSRGVAHGIKIIIERGEITFSIGSTAGGTEFYSGLLAEGEHSLEFTPDSGDTDFYLTASSVTKYETLIDEVGVETSGDMVLDTPYAETDLFYLRYIQSNDVVFISCDSSTQSGYQQYRIERRGTRSWSFVKYLPKDGPFRAINVSDTTITTSALSGDVTLTANNPLFNSNHVGALFRLTSIGQKVEEDVSGVEQYTNYIRVIGTGSQRDVTVERAGTWTATVTLQRSVGEPGAWVDVATYTSNGTTTYNDSLNEQIIYYRIGVKTGDYTSGTAELSLTYSSGTQNGVARVVGYTSSTQVSAIVLEDFGGTAATSDWYEGIWSNSRGWPTSVKIAEGRLSWMGRGWHIMSVSDAYDSFDDNTEGESAPIIRTIGDGPGSSIPWQLPLQRLIAGTDRNEISVRSSSLDELLTVDNYNTRVPSTQGSAKVDAKQVDKFGIFVQASNIRLFEIVYTGDYFDFDAIDLTKLVPDVGKPGILKLEVQRQPDTRVHIIRSDGTAAVLLYDPVEDIRCFVEVETDGLIEDVIIMPGTEEDKVYYVVNRTINSVTKRLLERWAMESDCVGGTQNAQADSCIIASQSSSTTISGLGHLEGEEVVVWADGVDYSPGYGGNQTTYTVSSGSITLSTAVEDYVVGLPYTAQFKSAKLAYNASLGTALNQMKEVKRIGFVLSNTHHKGLQYGPDFDNLDNLPRIYQGAELSSNHIYSYFDDVSMPFDGSHNPDARICLQASAPRPVTVCAATPTVNTHDRI